MQEQQGEREREIDRTYQNMIVGYSWMYLVRDVFVVVWSFSVLRQAAQWALQSKMILQAKPQLAVTTCVDNASADNMNQIESISSNI